MIIDHAVSSMFLSTHEIMSEIRQRNACLDSVFGSRLTGERRDPCKQRVRGMARRNKGLGSKKRKQKGKRRTSFNGILAVETCPAKQGRPMYSMHWRTVRAQVQVGRTAWVGDTGSGKRDRRLAIESPSGATSVPSPQTNTNTIRSRMELSGRKRSLGVEKEGENVQKSPANRI